jgi:hypothetical protein
MFKESEVLLAVLEDLAADDVPALPLHDGLMVAASKAEKAAEVSQVSWGPKRRRVLSGSCPAPRDQGHRAAVSGMMETTQHGHPA